MDEKMLAVTSRDLVAAEAHYHHSCYKAYTRQTSRHKDPDNIADDAYSMKEKESYDSLFHYIQNDLFTKPRIESVVDMTQKLVDTMKSLGVKDIKQGTKKHICRKLEAEFGKSIDIIADDKGKLFIIPDNLSRCMLVKENTKMVAELESQKSIDQDHVLRQSALYIRQDVKQSMIEQPWPPQPENLDSEYVPLPRYLTIS